MPLIGGYITSRELHRTGLGCVHAAAKSGTADAAFAVKTCQPDAMVLGEAAAMREVGEFLARAEAYKKIGDHQGCAQRWAKVHAIGPIPAEPDADGGLAIEGAFSVTDLATRATVEKLVVGKVALDGPALAWLIGEVVAALRDLDQALKRGHGNLKPSNVLICGTPEQELTASRVLLTDAAIVTPADQERVRLADLRAIGAMIHALVLHTRFQGGWPVENSPKWAALGSDGNKWRELVDTLLDPNPKAERPSLDELAERLAPMRIRKRSRKPLVFGIAAALLLAGGITTAIIYKATHHEEIKIVKWLEQPEQYLQKWKDLCGAYRGWYSLFQAGLDKPPSADLKDRGYKTRREAYSAVDPQLKALLNLPGVAAGYDPWSIAHVALDTDLSPLANTPTDHARSDIGVDKTEQALAAVDAVKKGLAEGWEAPQRLKTKAGEYRARAWNKAATVLDNAATNVNPDKAPDPSVAVDSVLGIADVVKKVDEAWGKIQQAAPGIATASDPVIARFGPAAADMVGAGMGDGAAAKHADLLTLEKQATAVADLAGRLETFVKVGWQNVDTESFTASPKYAALKTGSPSAETFDQWLAEAKLHPQLDPALDPRRGFSATELVGGLDQKATTLTSVPMRGTMDPAVGQRLAKVHEDVASIAPDKLVWKRSNQQRVESETARVKKELDDLRVAVDGLIEKRRTEIATAAAEVKRTLSGKSEIVQDSAAVNAAWKKWRDAILAKFVDDEYAQTSASAIALEDALKALDKSGFPRGLAKEGEGVPQTDWAAALAEASNAEREKRIAAALNALGEPPPDPAADAFKQATTAAAKDFGDWTTRLAQMRTELGGAEEALNNGQETTGPNSIESIVDKWSSDPIGKEPAVSQSIAGIKDRVAATRAVKAEKSLDVLVGKVLTPDAAKPEVTLAAWRRLGDADISWPQTPEQLAQVKPLKAELDKVIAKLPEARRAPLTKQVAADLSKRWAKYAASIKDAKRLESTIAVMPDFSVDEATLEPRLKYNLLLSRLKKSATPDADDEPIKQMLVAFEKNAQALGPDVSGAQSVRKLLSDASPISRGEEPLKPKIDPKTLGPGKLGGKWQATLDKTSAELTFTRGAVTLTFERVSLSPPGANGDDEAVYICTRELSIGDAIGIIEAAGNAAALQPLVSGISPKGVCGWEVDPRGTLSIRPWIKETRVTATLPEYAPGLLAAGQTCRVADAAGGEPKADSPLQAMPVGGLAFIARSAGCRFPTAKEWIAAHQLFDGGSTPSGSNLRDQTFDKQKAHVKEMRGRSTPAEMEAYRWPDTSAFAEVKPPPPMAENATPRQGNDGILLFAPTSTGGGSRVHHLVGNVAEFVVEESAKFESTAPAAIDAMLSDAKMAVIGGSALSAPELPIDKPLPVDSFDAGEGFADVGCRLAFNATGTAPPRESFAARLIKLLTDDKYLLAQ